MGLRTQALEHLDLGLNSDYSASPYEILGKLSNLARPQFLLGRMVPTWGQEGVNVSIDEWTCGKCLTLCLACVTSYENQLLIIMVMILHYHYIYNSIIIM